MAIEGSTASFEPRIKLGMVGGGSGAFIGAVHRIAARIDDKYELVAGALSSTPEKARQSGAELGLDPSRIYDDFKSMAIREAKLKNGIEAVAIVTPNHMALARRLSDETKSTSNPSSLWSIVTKGMLRLLTCWTNSSDWPWGE